MEAKRISQRAVKNMINGNTALLHIGNFDTGKRTNLKRAVSECVYTSRLYYNKELQSDNEKIEYLVYSQPYRVFKVELYETHIAAFNEYTEYHINFDDTSKYYTLVISGMQFLIVSDLGWCNIYQVFDSVVEELDKDPLFKEIKQSGVITNASPSDFVFKGFYNNGIGNWCNYLPIYEINGIEYVPMSQPYIIGRYE